VCNARGVDVEIFGRITLIGVAADGDGRGPTIAADGYKFIDLSHPTPQGHRLAISQASIRHRPRPNISMLARRRTDGVVARVRGRCAQLLLCSRRGNCEGCDYGKQWPEEQSAHFFPLT